MDPRQRHSRDKLRGAIEALLAEKPLDALTIEEITRTAGVTRPTFYSHYGSADALALDAVEAALARLGETFVAHHAPANIPPLERLGGFLAHLAAGAGKSGRMLELAMTGRAGEAAFRAVQAELSRLLGERARAVGTRMKKGELELVACFYGAAIAAVLAAQMRGEIKASPAQLGRTLAGLVHDGVGDKLGGE